MPDSVPAIRPLQHTVTCRSCHARITVAAIAARTPLRKALTIFHVACPRCPRRMPVSVPCDIDLQTVRIVHCRRVAPHAPTRDGDGSAPDI
jgi:hypothetical protein